MSDQLVMNNLRMLIDGDEPVMAYESPFKGQNYFHIRKMWRDRNGDLKPGKGLSVLVEDKDMLIKAISQMLGRQLKVA